ncbi:MAG: hypothetical protein ACD_12C00729G0004 [uncultured bacterium]|nr:MAG: hypothetical protein ACD_12C00729G0004 [uncultured bacterium]
MAQKPLEGRVSNPQGRHAYPGLSPAFFGLLMDSKDLSAPFFLQATEGIPGHVDHAAERMQHDYQMKKRFCDELMSGNGFTPEIKVWVFKGLTGIDIILKKKTKTTVVNPAQSIYVGETVQPMTAGDRKITKGDNADYELKLDGKKSNPMFEDWISTEKSRLQKAIETSDSKTSNLGGGLPPDLLVWEFYVNVLDPAMDRYSEKFKQMSKDEQIEITRYINYPPAGGPAYHRELIIDHFLLPSERQMLVDNFTKEKRSDGLFMTYGSQEGLSLMIRMLIAQGRATKTNPVILAVTDPTYPGLLMAAKEYVKLGLIKFRLVPLDEKSGNIDTDALRTAFDDERCMGFYLAEGNPIPTQIQNLEEVAKVGKEEKYLKKWFFDDHAYDRLGATEEGSLIDILPGRVVAFKTFSKQAAPFRVGVVYSNMSSEDFARVKEDMLGKHYNASLGYAGPLSRTVANILELDAETEAKDGIGVFAKHIKRTQEYYEGQRQLYEKFYKEALEIAFGTSYKIENEVTIAKSKFMFGYRHTGEIDSVEYFEAGEEIKLVSVPGSDCRPNPADIVGEKYLNSSVNFSMRQNYTSASEQKLHIGILKDVLLEVIFSKMGQKEKRKVVETLYEKMKETNEGKPLLEVEEFIERMKGNNYEYVKKPLSN